jgi:hypothetical protein
MTSERMNRADEMDGQAGELGKKLEKFHLSIGSVFAGLLLFGGLQTLIKVLHDPIAFAVIRLLNYFVKSNALNVQQPPTDWPFLGASMATLLIFLAASVIFGARTTRVSGDRA